MKKLFLSLLALVVLGIGAYVWANRISGDELPELLTGEYELLRWELVSNGEQPDSLMLRHLPKVGDRVHLTYLSESELSITTQSDKLLLRSACCDAWKMQWRLCNGWFLPDYSIEQYFWAKDADNNFSGISLTTYCSQRWCNERAVSLWINIYNKDNDYHWRICYGKQ